MAVYVVLRATAGQVPPLNEIGSADVYRGDHPTETDAVNAASAIWRSSQGAMLYAVLQSSLTRYVISHTSAVG